MRFTLDTNILVRALASPRGPAAHLLDLILRNHTLVLSRFILDELGRVLLYPRLQRRYAISPAEIARFLDELTHVSSMVEPVIAQALVAADSADDAVLYTAADGRADYLCTRNIDHFSGDVVAAFCKSHRILVKTDLEILRDVFDSPVTVH